MRWRRVAIVVPSRCKGIMIMKRILSKLTLRHRHSTVGHGIVLRKSVWWWYCWDIAVIVVDASSLG